jgi:hypothetical protein
MFSTGLSSNSSISIPSGTSNWRYMRVAAVNLSLDDQSDPVFYSYDTSLAPTGWSKSTSTIVLPFSGWDNGLGIAGFYGSVKARLGGNYHFATEYGCDGTAASPCPGTVNGWTHPANERLSLDLNKVADGINTVSTVATDALGKQSAPRTFTLKLDRDGPSLLLSGSLWNRRSKTIGSAIHHLSIEANDGTAAEPRSGTVAIRVIVDGVPDPSPVTQACSAGNCALDRQFSVDPAVLGSGSHTIKVEAEDALGNISSRTITVTVDAGDECADMEEDAETLCQQDNGTIYLVSTVSEAITSGGEMLAIEFVQPSTLNARSVTPQGSVSTRGVVSCPNGVCGTVRHATPSSDSSGTYDWSEITGTAANDPDLEVVGMSLRPWHEDFGTSTGTIPTRQALRGWQTPPPGVSSNLNIYVIPGAAPNDDGYISDTWWVDPNTGFPIRQTSRIDVGNGPEDYYVYYSYSPNMWKPADLQSDLFVQSQPTPISTTDNYSASDWAEAPEFVELP